MIDRDRLLPAFRYPRGNDYTWSVIPRPDLLDISGIECAMNGSRAKHCSQHKLAKSDHFIFVAS